MSDDVFARMAPRYDELRGDSEDDEGLLEVSVEEGLADARRLLDVGCGTGRFAALIAQRYGTRIWGVDASAEMLAHARARGVRGAGWKVARADALPFRAGWFDAALMRLAVHLLGDARQASLAEIARVLSPGGRLYIWTFGPEHFTGFYLAPYLPSLPAVDLARFPDPDVLAGELRAAGFASVRERPFEQRRPVERARAAERLRGGYISTVHLLPPDEVAGAIERLEQEAAAGEPPLVAHLRWRLVVGVR